MRTALLTALVAVTALAGCSPCDEAKCEPICAPKVAAKEAEIKAASPQLTAFEQELLKPVIEDVRAGVRPWSDQSIGICKGTKDCDEFLGAEVGELPPGQYLVMAELRVPKTGEPGAWSITFDTECTATRTTPSGESSSTSNSSRSYDVRYAGEQRGYRLLPLRTIESPSTGGSRKCTYKITAPHPDGDKVYTGGWSTPAAAE